MRKAAAFGIATILGYLAWQNHRTRQQKAVSSSTTLHPRECCAQKKAAEGSSRPSQKVRTALECGTDDFAVVLDFWFSGSIKDNYKNKWFPSSTSGAQQKMDDAITQQFSNTLRAAEQGLLDTWKQHADSCLALIVVLDQFSRHVYRHEESRASIEANDVKARQAADHFLARGWQLTLGGDRLAFLLLPYRHQRTHGSISKAVAEAQAGIERNIACADLLAKFLAFSKKELEAAPPPASSSPPSSSSSSSASTSASSSLSERWDVLLEKRERVGECNDAAMSKEPLVREMKEFLRCHGALRDPVVLISLSGGVDSMVITEVLAHLVRTQPSKYPFRVVAVHVDYGNREEAHEEAAFVRDWCVRHNVEPHVRVISEMQRATSDRDEYERETRNIRFSTYMGVQAQTGARAVMFGHHEGDVRENVVSNSMKGQALTGLGGMSPSSVVNKVTIWRPLLPFEKKQIFAFAHTYGTPYFKDSTPKWSTRGKLRDKLLPLLEDMYGKGVHVNLSKVAKQSAELREIVYNTLLGPALGHVSVSSMCASLDITDYSAQPAYFWKEVLREMCHALHVGAVRDKALYEFVGRLREGWGREKGGQRFVAWANAGEGAGGGEGGTEKGGSDRADAAQDAKARAYRTKGLGIRSREIKDGWVPLKRKCKTCIKEGRLFLFKASLFPFSMGRPTKADEGGAEERDGKREEKEEDLNEEDASAKRKRVRLQQGEGLWMGQTPAGTRLKLGVNNFGPWTVIVSLEDAGAEGTKGATETRSLLLQRRPSMMDVCSGRFSYCLAAPAQTGQEGGPELVVCNLESSIANTRNKGKYGREAYTSARGPVGKEGGNGRKKGAATGELRPGSAAFALELLDSKLCAAIPAADIAARVGLGEAGAALNVEGEEGKLPVVLRITYEYREPGDLEAPGWQKLQSHE